MDTNQSFSQPPVVTYTRPPGIFAGKLPSTITFALALLLFLLPFAEIRCGNTALTQKSGLDFALSNKWKPASGYGKEFLGKETSKSTTDKEGNSPWFAIAAIGLTALALICCLGNPKLAGTGGLVSGLLAIGAVIALMVELKRWFSNTLAKEAANKATDSTDYSLDGVSPTLGFTTWSYVIIVALLAACYFCYRRKAENRT